MPSLPNLFPRLSSDIIDISTVIWVLLAVFSIHLVRVSRARFRAIKNLQKRFGTLPEEFKNIDYKAAQTIVTHLYGYETPWMYKLSQDYAILRTFALPAVSKLAGEMIGNTGLRYSSTYALGREWLVNPLDSERSMLAINRVNYIHSRYKGIENDTLLFTLCSLMCEVLEWVDKYEYRQAVPLERYASYVLWKEIGIRMGIKESSIPGSFEECAQFIKDYQDEEMLPNQNSVEIGQAVIRMYHAALPKFLRPLCTNIFIYMLDPKVRDTFELTVDESPIIGTLTRLFPLALTIRGKFIRYCLLPPTRRPTAFTPATDGVRMNVTIWKMMPYYVQATRWNRWGPTALYRRTFGLPVPGKEWMTDGYKLEEIGHGGKGGKKVLEVMDRAQKGECPFSTFGRVENEGELGGVYAKYHSPSLANGEKSP